MRAALPLPQARPAAREDDLAGSSPGLSQFRAPAIPDEHRSRTTGDLVRVFDEDPDLLGDLDPATVDLLRHRAVAPKLWIDPGPWTPPAPEHQRGWFGLLVLEGLIVRSVQLEDRDCPEVIGAGDLLRPWDHDEEISIPVSVSWSAHERTTLAILDDRFARVICRWPTIVSGLLARSVRRSRTLAFQRAIVHVRHAETRLRMLLWHLADRWGRVTLQGVHLPLALTQETLAHLSCMRRPTASTALQILTRNGELERRPDGTWLLKGDRPSAAA